MRYAPSHEWIFVDSDEIGTIGISEYAQKELGAIVFVQLPVIGQKVKAGEEVVVLESTKAAADIYSPVSGMIVSINDKIVLSPNLLNVSAENEGWLFKIQLLDASELQILLSRQEYLQLIGGAKPLNN